MIVKPYEIHLLNIGHCEFFLCCDFVGIQSNTQTGFQIGLLFSDWLTHEPIGKGCQKLLFLMAGPNDHRDCRFKTNHHTRAHVIRKPPLHLLEPPLHLMDGLIHR